MFETQGGTRNRARDLPKKGSAFILSSDHWTKDKRVILRMPRWAGRRSSSELASGLDHHRWQPHNSQPHTAACQPGLLQPLVQSQV